MTQKLLGVSPEAFAADLTAQTAFISAVAQSLSSGTLLFEPSEIEIVNIARRRLFIQHELLDTSVTMIDYVVTHTFTGDSSDGASDMVGALSSFSEMLSSDPDAFNSNLQATAASLGSDSLASATSAGPLIIGR